MGKISDALEKHKKERVINAEKLPSGRSEDLTRKEPETAPARESIIQKNFSHKLVVHSAPESIDAENFKVLRAQVLFPKDGKTPRTIMVTSAFPGEGKTFVSSNLAASIALGINEYVLLVDCDFRRPSMHKMFGCSNTEGLHEYLTKKKDLPDLLIRTRMEKLTLLTAGTYPPNPSELLSSIAMKEFLEEVRGRYEDRYIIIDATPSQVTSEVSVLSQYVDGIVFVVLAQKSPKETIQKSVENLGKKKILGIVFNGYSESYKSYHKYYKKYYK
jgi:exopolysaccharide/PEP-CTERM locus tyrosine autokinase